MLLLIYQNQLESFPVYKIQCHKTLLRTCLKNGWVEEKENDTVIVTDAGLEAAMIEIAPLYERNKAAQIGQTFSG
jgi:hypothetical protein